MSYIYYPITHRDYPKIPTKLSLLEVDTDKDWGGKNIINLGAGGHDVNARLNLLLAHAARHEEGGADALTPANIGANWNKLVNKPSTFPPSAHESNHELGGLDEIPSNDILLRLQKHLGVFWFNNHWLPIDMLRSGQSGSGSVAWYSSYVALSTGTTSDSYAYVDKSAYGLSGAYSWDKKRWFGVYVRIFRNTAQNIHIVSGASSNDRSTNLNPHIGFKVINDALYGTVADGTTESTLLLETIPAAVYRRLECVLDPAIPECRFYVDGVDKGAITTNLPAGTSMADLMLKAVIHNTEAVNKILYIYEVRTLQEE